MDIVFLTFLVILTSSVCGDMMHPDLKTEHKIQQKNLNDPVTKKERISDVDLMNAYMDTIISKTIEFMDELKLEPQQLPGNIRDFSARDPAGDLLNNGTLADSNKYEYGILSMTREKDVQITYNPDGTWQVDAYFKINNWKIKELLDVRWNDMQYSGQVVINQGASVFAIYYLVNPAINKVDLRTITLTYGANPNYSVEWNPPFNGFEWVKEAVEENLIFDLYGIPAGYMMALLRTCFRETMSLYDP